MREKWSDDKIIQYASAVAGLVCERFPGVLSSPSQTEVATFIQGQEKAKQQ
jgi:sugar/nucleoside kinase (ribokinase family)